MSARQSDIALLQPTFRVLVEELLQRMRGQGFHPVLFETLRSKERALEMVAKGVSKARGGLSMHSFGCAADIICADHGWSCRKNQCKFFETLGNNAMDLGLTWGGNWDRDQQAGEDGENDLPHVQIVPVGRWQNLVRKAPAEHIDTLIASYRAGLVR